MRCREPSLSHWDNSSRFSTKHFVQIQKGPQNTESLFVFVEVPRIELGSDDIDQGLLRAQPLCRLFSFLFPCGPRGKSA